MKISGSWQRLILGFWIIAALSLIGHNTSRLMTLLSPPIAGRSIEVRLASQKWRQLQNKISRGSQAYAEFIDLDRALLGISPDTEKIEAQVTDTLSDKNKPVQEAALLLPILSGILRNTDIHGRASATAVIDGYRLKENDSIQGFKIQKILEDGVVITSSGQRWFLKAPNVAYSKIHRSSNGADDSQQ